MRKTAAVSFEGESVKIVHASLKGKNLSVHKSEVIPDSELADYLKKEKSSEFTVICEFKESYHDILTVPVSKPRYLGKIVESEIRRTTGKKNLSFIYSSLGERVVENRKALDVFYFAVSSEDIRDIVDRFHDNGKTVVAIYPSVFSAASLVEPSTSLEANMGVLCTGQARTSFFTKGSVIYFIRNYESIDTEFGNFDIQNINMTINYCFQNLRINPSSVLLMGSLSGSSEVTTLPTAPLASLHKAENIRCSHEQFNSFILPIASFFTSKTSNILSKDFRNIYALKKYMSYASIVFVILAVLCLGVIVYEAKDIADRKKSIELARNNMTDIEEISSEYNEIEDRISRYRPAVEFVNRATTDIRKLLIELDGIDTRGLTIDNFEASAKEDNTYSVSINGTGLVETYSSLEAQVKSLVDKMNKTDGVKVTDKTLDLQNRTFRIEMEYRKTG